MSGDENQMNLLEYMGKFLATEQRYLGRVCNWLGTDIPTLEIDIFPQKNNMFFSHNCQPTTKYRGSINYIFTKNRCKNDS